MGYLPAGTGAVATTVQSKLRESVSVLDFGAMGNGVTNDTAAFAAAAAYINLIGGGTLVIPPGTYLVGKQTFAGVTGQNYAYQAVDVLKITGCTRPVVIDGRGAILKADPALKFGAFNPVTGNRHNPAGMPFTAGDYIGNAYNGMIQLVNNTGGVTVRNLELDGNIANLVLGGTWGDTGRQLSAHGIRAYGNSSVMFENIYSHHHGCDGIMVGFPGLTSNSEPTPHTFINVRAEYNGRQGLSIVGGIGFKAVNCKFSHTGRAVNAASGEIVASNPGAGVDLEAESAVIRRAAFDNCEFVNNYGSGMVADSGDTAEVTFSNCLFWGVTNYSIWPNKNKMAFSDCRIYGAWVGARRDVNALPGVPHENGVKFARCHFEDKPWTTGAVYLAGGGLFNTTDLSGTSFKDCSVTLNTGKLDILIGAHVDGMLITSKTTVRPNQDYLILAGGCVLRNVYIKDEAAHTTADGYYINVDTNTGLDNCFIDSPSNKIGWGAWVSGGGMVGNSGKGRGMGSTQPDIMGQYAQLIKFHVDRSARAHSVRTHSVGTSAPTTLAWKVGDLVYNANPSAGGFVGWVCTVAGTPGTWKTFGAISA